MPRNTVKLAPGALRINQLESDHFLHPSAAQQADYGFAGEGQLSCDVYQDRDHIVVVSMLAGVDTKDLDIAVSNDLLTIRGIRRDTTTVGEEDYFARECYWGAFSRSIVLPQEVDPDKVKATLKNGVLTVKLPKKYKTTVIKIRKFNG